VRPLIGELRGLLWLFAALALIAGVLLFGLSEDTDRFFSWTGFGVAAAHAAVENDLARFEGAALAYTALGLLELAALARYSGDLTGASIDTWAYVAFLASVIVVGGYASALARRSSIDSSAAVRSS